MNDGPDQGETHFRIAFFARRLDVRRVERLDNLVREMSRYLRNSMIYPVLE